EGSYCRTNGGNTPSDFGTADMANATCCCTRVCAELRSVPHLSHTKTTDRLLREVLWTKSTPGVALTYFSMRQVIVFSTSFGPSPGASVPTTRTGGVNSGNVSTLMRGVTTAANTTRPTQIIRIAMGFLSAKRVTAEPPWRPRSRRYAPPLDRAWLPRDHRPRARRAPRSQRGLRTAKRDRGRGC